MDSATSAPADTAPAAAPSADALIDVRLTNVHFAARDTNLYEFSRADGRPLPPYTPGAHVDLHLPNGIVRQYSMVRLGPNPTVYTFGIKRDPVSRGGSRHVHDEFHVGQVVRISPPRNNFPLVEDAALTILIAGGIGITPIRAMVHRLVDLGRPWKLYYACRARAEMAFLDELSGYQEAQFHFDDEHAGAVLDLGPIVNDAPKHAHLYCCGPAPMLRSFEIATAGWPQAQVHVEYFTPKQEPAKAGGFVVELQRSGREFFIPEGKSILQVLLDEGVDLDYSCELGICGACEQRVVSGVPEHRDSILSEEEQAENKRVMICCAGCKSERLVLDL